ncbi:putative cytoplasmic protein [Papiliotrema laurentii]|uniref:Cytoplasmic protein n=1 Tax=Papiliotrema laurentii TaxID=5418 RepID=A0AAD9CY32_PAPLA|nr:putative cytoplasmic protein [Papiliotrema laurentii]
MTVSPYPYDTGLFGRPITTSIASAQEWFNRGLAWTYAFNHLEAARCFELALVADPSCAAAYWGLAYAVGPNYNKSLELFDPVELQRTIERVRTALEQAKACKATPIEKGLIEALEERYAEDAVDNADRSRRYAARMRRVYEEFPTDLDVAALFADALMNLGPWDLWDTHTGAPREQFHTLEIKKILETALASDPAAMDHPGILHFYTHLMEMSPTPELALRPAARLIGLIPDGGHLHHMPSHLDLLVGDYGRAITSNLAAIKSNEKYAQLTSSTDFYTFYRVHDYNTLIYAAMLGGAYAVAIQGVEGMEEALPENLLRIESPPMADWLEVCWSTRAEVLVRFGKWDEILALAIPEDQKLYSYTTAILHYAKGIAHSVLGNVPAALSEQALFQAAATRVPDTRLNFPNKCSDMLRIASAMLEGEIAYRQSDYSAAFAQLRKAVELSDGLVYSEPWSWKQPARHAYAALSLEQGLVEQAMEAYAQDLGLSQGEQGRLPRAQWHPKNIWALSGYHECLVRLGRESEASEIGIQLEKARELADVTVEVGCYCAVARKAGGGCCT